MKQKTNETIEPVENEQGNRNSGVEMNADVREDTKRELDEVLAEIPSLDQDVAKETESGLSRSFRDLNLHYPWLKIVVAITVILGLGVVAWESVHKPADAPKDVPEAVSEEQGVDVGETADGKEQPSDEPIEAKEGDLEVHFQPQPQIAEAIKKQIAEAPVMVTSAPAPVVVRDYQGRKLIALTFDDGPLASTTPRLLDILAQKQVRATFFVVGTMAQRAPDLVRREIADGHEVGSHTLGHRDLTTLSAADIRGDAAQMSELLEGITGVKLNLIRPPYGSVNGVVRATEPQVMVIWSVDPEDWKYRNANTVYANVMAGASDGAIVLMHDIHSTTVDAVPRIIDSLREQGYEFVTVSELAAARGVQLEQGKAYGRF